MIIERDDKKNTTTIYTAGTSAKTTLVKDICKKNKNYNDKALFQLDNITLEKIKRLTCEGFFVAYADLQYSTKKLSVKGLNLSNISKLVAIKLDGSVRYIK